MTRTKRALLGAAGGLGAWFLVVKVFGFGQADAYVECVQTLAGLSCTVTHRAGRSSAKVCWDVVSTCANGVVATGSGCGSVTPEAKTVVIIPWSEVRNWSACDAVRSVSMTNMKVELQ
jgi:hypothetical protein